ncbi:sensor histidine kinase [Citricoccus muralis]|uniref:Histidine kinase n=1 Tax=Citricoccus muralis TaxID=169134 RepID=A0ABY8H315_9MICC|nr:ATP-binding protein [Citricoccus muralis]WFP15341.1 histidine kinase [Citricoccus muralis]
MITRQVRQMNRTTRRAILLHTASTVAVTAAMAVASSLISTAIAVEVARSNAEVIADTVAHAVVAPLTLVDLVGPNAEDPERIADEFEAFIDGGVLERVKIWQLVGDEAVVIYSDEPRNEGVRRAVDSELGARLDRGEVVVLDVPDDAEHQHEQGNDDLLEAFIGFTDASGHAMRLELYLVSTESDSLAAMLGVVLPISILGPAVLGAATLPLALRLARQLSRREEERQQLLHAALAASDRERHRLSARLHDHVIQDLASLGLTLERLGVESFSHDRAATELLQRAGELLDTDIEHLRTLLSEIAPSEFNESLETALGELARDLTSGRVRIDVDLDLKEPVGTEVATLIYRAARELVRNALDHGSPETVRLDLRSDHDGVNLCITDDGVGFDPQEPAPPGHCGISLIRHAVTDRGGSLDISSDEHGTRVEVWVPRDEPSRPAG